MKALRVTSVYKLCKDHLFRWNLLAFTVFLALFYIWMAVAKPYVSFEKNNYDYNSHHYQTEAHPERSDNLLHNLAVYDANFYLNIADNGYPKSPDVSIDNNTPKTESIGLLSYAFAPGYPLLLAAVNSVIGNIYVSAFVMSITLAIICFISVWWFVSETYGHKLALKATWLIMLLPSAFFLYGYYTEALTIILLAGLLNAYSNKSIWLIALFTGLLSITRFSMLVLIVVFAGWLIVEVMRGRIVKRLALAALTVSIVPLCLWIIFCWLHGGDPLLFLQVRLYWGAVIGGFFVSLAHFPELSLHFFHSSKLDTICILVSGILLALSYRWLPKQWWIITVSLWIFAIASTDTMSGMRYQLVLLPLYIWLAYTLKGKWYMAFLICSTTLLFTTALFGINYWWIG